jgi:ATP-binding cassette, subfamily F, member 3
VAKRYGTLRVFDSLDLKLERGQKIALVGPNGAGKSTLMRILAGTESVDAGQRIEGLRLSVDHFAQDQADQLPGDRTILEEAIGRAPNDFVPQVRGLLGAFLFSGDAVDKKIAVLSGGERNRLALALMLMHPCNLLLLDEPTNHLDMAAKDVLLEALRSYEGTLVFVSHDRYFLAGLATRVLEAGGGTLIDHPGDYESFVWKKRQMAAGVGAATDAAGRDLEEFFGSRARGKPEIEAVRTAPAGSRGAGRASKRQVRELESRIADLEERKGRLETQLARQDLYRDPEKSAFYLSEYQQVSKELERAFEEWVEATGEGEA